ncbi:hypothetical protein [Sediminicola luteus]|uniref:Uncharacterized protein n=1 Tax=Sediminicola luteus TaxID=319238 RepID=A0A2A4G7A0_9FLAO|nr:hypothetical protein [Sediminicola luteus]PCE64849.1 hypothetical protein B7P33_06690 [Sediminicola luteus]
MRLFFVTLIVCKISFCQERVENIGDRDCEIYLKPILGFDIKAYEEIESALNKFDEREYDSSESLSHVEYDRCFYNVKKEIKIDGLRTVNLKGRLAFNNETKELVYYRIELEIGKDMEYYYFLMDFLEEKDTERRNEFIYKRKRMFNSSKVNGCYRVFSYSRSYENDSPVVTIRCAL